MTRAPRSPHSARSPDRFGRDSDVWCVSRLAAGDDPDALGVLFARYGRKAFAVARQVCGCDVLAQDAVQEAMLQCWQGARDFDASRGTVAAWLLTIVHHRAVDRVRRETQFARRALSGTAPEPDRLVFPDPGGPDSGHATADTDVGARVRAALRHLPDGQRHVLLLCYFAGYSHAETAAALAIPLGTVRSRCYQAVRHLRKQLAIHDS